MSKIDFEKDLNKEQAAVATADDGIQLVLAAAGTGKTRTLVYRVAYLVEKGINPEGILLLTFTNRAAREMTERAESLVGAGVSGMWGGTFHHMANRILRRHARLIGYGSDYTILDRDDSQTLVLNCVKDLGLHSKEFPKSRVLLSLFSSSANTETPVEAIIRERMKEYISDLEEIELVHKEYEKRKRKLDAMDFDDLLVNCILLFREKENVLEQYQRQFHHVLVDEYQDTNTIQAELVDKIAGKNGNLFVVGDDFQCIYSWRGANFRNILSFPEKYPSAHVYKLETNYRSVPEILDVANACIAGNPEQFQKTLRPTRETYKKPVVAKMRDGDEQARFVVEHIRTLKRSGYKLSEIAVLYRAHYHAMELQLQLARDRIPYMITSGVRFFEQAHIKDVCSILKILECHEDELSFSRLLCLMPGVGPKTAIKIWKKLGGKFNAKDEKEREQVGESLPASAMETWKAIEPIMQAYNDENLWEDGGEVIYRFVKAFYEKHAVNIFDDHKRRLDDINELSLYMSKFESTEQFLCDVALLTNLDAETEEMTSSAEDSLRLSTVHQAKGLEWSAVIILWAAEGMFPSGRSLKESENGEAEERRLFYVAVTRAKDELLMCVPELRRTRDGGVVYYSPSRFVNELPRELIDEHRVGFI